MKGEEFKDDYRKALPKEVVQRLTRRSPWRATAAVLHDLAVLALAISVGLYFWPNPIILLICVVVIGTRQHALFVIAHDAAGIPYAQPEIALLFKAKATREKDEADFARVLPLLGLHQRQWLAQVLELIHPQHHWLSELT